ncbi:oxidoreductase FAD/NAD(P)-binding domain protein [mine drainage metagenome]|uniref:Oxidoreductase FAD/NAD(P)-binding domain protein n=1 Tax=mine drainage metagenome TaxID=410659 RepID=T1CAL3_9ZZZZ
MAARGADPEAPSSPWVPLPFSVRERKSETPDTVTIVLAPQNRSRALSFLPGQFNMLYLFGVGEAPISICGNTDWKDRYVHTIRGVGKITTALCRSGPGSVVGVRGPYGIGWPLDQAYGKDVVIVGGGLGLPPLRPLLYELLRRRDQFGRIEVIYGARTPKDLVYYDEIQSWRARSDLRFQTTVDAAEREWYGDVGVVTARLPDARFEPKQTVAYLCGPEIMMKLTAQALVARGVAPDSIWLSMERNMKCAVGICGHCQFGPDFVCRDGPVFRYTAIERALSVREI